MRHLLNRVLGAAGYELVRKRHGKQTAVYDRDGLSSHHNHDFEQEAAFARAYQRGVTAVGKDHYRWHWRVHVGLWVAANASRLRGDFVECGVNYGFLSSAIMTYLDWNRCDKLFYLLDTFAGLHETTLTQAEIAAGAKQHNANALRSGHYTSNVDAVRANFAEWQRVQIIEGIIPETLPQVTAEEIAYLHLDLNSATPEVAAAEYFWKRLVPGAFVLMDDYAYEGFSAQKAAMDAWAAPHNVPILSLPTGQGLLIKPPGC